MSRLRELLSNRSSGQHEESSPPTRDPQGAAPPKPRVYVARAELVLAHAAALPLATLPLRPEDPLQAVANAVADIRLDLGERAEVCLDLVPLTPAKVAHLSRQADRAAAPAGQEGGLLRPLGQALGEVGIALGGALVDIVAELLPHGHAARRDLGPTAAARNSPAPRAGTSAVNKFAGTADAVFAAQVLVRCESEIPGRAQMYLRRLIGAFDVLAGANRWKVRGLRVLGHHVGADSILYRRRFDLRWNTGLAVPAANSVVTSTEIAGWLKPPTMHCSSPAVARSRGWIPPAPRELPTYTGQRDLVRLGWVVDLNGEERLVGIPLTETLFSARFGKAGFGKTETALAQAIDLARKGLGVWFLDPHADGWRRAKPYLSDPDLRSRLWEIDLTVRGHDARLPGWNPLSMEGFSVEHLEDRVDAVVTSFASALNWGDAAPRAKSILTKACETLCHLALRLPADCAPTIFQIATLLDEENWREDVIRYLPRRLGKYWAHSFPKLAAEATPVITNLINRIASSPTLSAFLGSSRSTYDVRHAMDTSKIVFVCTPGSGESTRLVTGFLIYDLFRAGRSRVDLDPQHRRRYDAFIDELAAVDGASRGHLAAILEQLRKYKVALHAMNQMPDRLSPDTRRALFQNQSLLMSSAAALDGARSVAREFGGEISASTVINLEQFHHVVTATLGGQRSTPFKVRGLHVDDEYAEYCHPEWDALVNTAIDTNLARRPIRQTLEELDTLDDRILAALRSTQGTPSSHRGRPPASAVRASGRGVDLNSPVAAARAETTEPGTNTPVDVPSHPNAPSPYTSTVE